MKNKVYAAIAIRLQAIKNCENKASRWRFAKEPGNKAEHDNAVVWIGRHRDAIDAIVKEHLPSGSGFDSGVHFDEDASHVPDEDCEPGTSEDAIVLRTSFHHMDENGTYCGWSESVIRVTPSLAHGAIVKIETDYSGVDDEGYEPDEEGNAWTLDRDGHDEYLSEVFNEALNTEIERGV